MDVRQRRVEGILAVAGWDNLPQPASPEEIEYALTQLAEFIAISPHIEGGDLVLLRELAEARLRKVGLEEFDAHEAAQRVVRRAIGMRTADKIRAEREDEEEKGNGKDPEDGCSFRVHGVRIWDSDPKTYELSIDGRPVEFSAKELATTHAFSLRFANAIGPFPTVPTKKGAWLRLVNHWIASATTISLPPESSAGFVLQEKIKEAIGQLSIGQEIEDLDRGAGIVKDDLFCFKTIAILDSLSHHLKATAHTVTKILKTLGYESKTVRFSERKEDRRARVWTSPVIPNPTSSVTPVTGTPTEAESYPEEDGL